MKIRKATAKDIPAMAELSLDLQRYESKLDPLLKDPKKSKKSRISYLEKKFRKRNTTLFVAEENGIIGFVMGELQKLSDIYKHKSRGFVHDIFVKPKYRKKGIGTALLDEMMNWFEQKGAKVFEISAYTDNKTAIEFYEQYGFEPKILFFRKMQ